MPERARGQEPVWDQLAPAYGLAGPDHFSALARRLVQVVPLDPAVAVLDLACGAGAVASAVASLTPSAKLVAVDLSWGVVRRAAAEVPRRGVPCAVALMNAELLAFANRTFGTVLCGSALDNFPDPARALAEAHRVLRPGGCVGLWVAPTWWWQGDPRWNWHGDLLASLGIGVGRIPAGLDGPESLREMIQSAGFQDVRVREHQLGLRFHNAGEWWQWARSHGFRQVMEEMTVDQFIIYRETAFGHIGTSGIEGRTEALIATGITSTEVMALCGAGSALLAW